jgi:hypothetical protein
MKVTVNVECTPEEARAFLGLPDVAPMQKALMADLEQRMRTNLTALNPEAMIKTWMPTGIPNLEQMQKLFWSNLQQSMNGFTTSAPNALTASSERGDKS